MKPQVLTPLPDGPNPFTVHAAVLAINQAIENKVPEEELARALKNPSAGIQGVNKGAVERYRVPLFAARSAKVPSAAACSTLTL